MRKPISSLPDREASAFRTLLGDGRVLALRAALGPDAELCLVGGAVRDVLLGKHSFDLDFASRLGPDELQARLQRAGIRTIPTGLKHQTVTALPLENASHVEITSFRGAGMNPAGGVVLGGSIEEDLEYRDFTVNALALDLVTAELVDLSFGLKDIKARVIRAVGNPQTRFAEDPLRALRMVRFACFEGFTLDADTKAGARGFSSHIITISIERVRDELNKILVSDNPDFGLRLLAELGFLQHILPEVERFIGFEQNKFHRADLFNHTLEVVKNSSPDLILRLAALFHDVGKPDTLSIDPVSGERHFFKHESIGAEMTREILKRLKYSHEITDSVCTLVYTHMRPLNAGPPGLRRILRDTGEHYDRWRELKEVDTLACNIDPEVALKGFAAFDSVMAEVLKGPKLSPLSSLAINGNDLLSLGLGEGRQIGELLRALHELVLDDPELNTREALLNKVQELRKTTR